MYRISAIALITLFFLACQGSDNGEAETSRTDTTRVRSENGYARIASDYESAERVIWQKPELVIDKMGFLKGKTVADIGAGTGYFAFRIADRGARVVAIDIDPRALAWMDNEENDYSEDIQERFSTRLASEDNPNLEPGEADVILMVNTYGYIEDRVSYFTTLREGILPGGEIYIVDFKKVDTPIGPPLEERVASSTVSEELREAGYAIVEIDTTSLEYQYILTAEPDFGL